MFTYSCNQGLVFLILRIYVCIYIYNNYPHVVTSLCPAEFISTEKTGIDLWCLYNGTGGNPRKQKQKKQHWLTVSVSTVQEDITGI